MAERQETLPKFPDEGCDWNPVPDGCLNCPFEKCRHDMTVKEILAVKKGPQYLALIERYDELVDAGSQVMEAMKILAKEFGVTPRQVRRVRQKWLDPTKQTKPKPEKICSVDGCFDRMRSRGYCNKHLYRFYVHGDPLAVKRPGRKPASLA